MISIWRKAAVSVLSQAAKSSVIDGARVSAGAGLLWGGCYLFDAISNHSFFGPKKQTSQINEPDLDADSLPGMGPLK
ncbi:MULTISPECIES: hypothetical protein [Legionella]|uniref:Uncharacterized protein n=1 Tax=Legionella maceachernii TaxID=466 RepID=A0A0W0VXN4_9GAMM|nr:hypothetical protein [Legionella maceachernii]KTD24670.1 hypothetical protein Lmac_2757 [Legionella maceachernii]SKA26589.1 hypothetical protein SAMN02745128_02913 [Legionella maceachernii]SUP01870.1 Uncharacterised protein [Legionella maceachernii]